MVVIDLSFNESAWFRASRSSKNAILSVVKYTLRMLGYSTKRHLAFSLNTGLT